MVSAILETGIHHQLVIFFSERMESSHAMLHILSKNEHTPLSPAEPTEPGFPGIPFGP